MRPAIVLSPPCSPSHAERVATYGAVSTALERIRDQRLAALIEGAAVVSSGIGGKAVLLEIEGTPVFAKRLALTDLERRPEHVMSTANLHGIPTFCHYGVGSVGGGAWREWAAHAMTTGWVLAGDCENFPLMYHWRVLPEASPRTPTAEDRAEIARMVDYWDGSAAVGVRLTEMAHSSASVVLFCEYVPRNLHDWLTEQRALGPDALEAACAMVERDLRSGVEFMNAHGLWHFDAHFRNVLTDGRRLYVTDFGLAASSQFALSDAERAFLHTHASHDGCYAVTQLINWLVCALVEPADAAERNAVIRRYAAGDIPASVPAWAASVLARYAPIAVVLNDFYRALHGDTRTAPYPAADIERVCAAIGFEPVRTPAPAATR